MAINTTTATMQMRRGNEADFESDKMMPGEWAVSLDSRYVRMCFSPGLCIRMATYEGFEEDMREIQKILKECQDIKEAVQRFAELAEEHSKEAESWAHGRTGIRDGEDTDNSEFWSQQSKSQADRAQEAADRAEAVSGIGIATTQKAGIVKPDGVSAKVEKDGTLSVPGSKPDFYGAYEDFPLVGDPDILYIDNTVDPRLMYTWDLETSTYILTGGAGGADGSSIDIPITLPAVGWTGEAAPYSQTVTVPQMRETMTPLLYFSGMGDDAQYAYSLITGYEAGYAQMTFYAADLPQVDIPITLKGIPAQQLEYADNTLVVVVPADGFILNEDLGRYEQTIMVEGMAAGANGGWDIVRSGEVLTEAESKIALSITDVIPLDGAIKIVCLWEPGQQYMLKLTGTYTQATEGTTLLAGMQGWFDRVDKLEDNIGDKFSETKTYAVGDYCIYEDVLYKFTAAKDAGEWDLTTVASTKVTTELNSLNKSQFIQEHFVSPPSGVSVGASSYVNHVVDVSKEGYIPIALINIWTGNSSIVLYGNTINSLTGRAVIGLRNTSTSSQAGVVQYSVLYEVAE